MMGPVCTVIVMDPTDVKTVLGSQKLITKADEYDFIRPWLGDGLLISTGKKWSQRRKIMTPAFHFKILEEFVEIFNKQSETLVKNLAKFKGQEINIFTSVNMCTLDIICGEFLG